MTLPRHATDSAPPSDPETAVDDHDPDPIYDDDAWKALHDRDKVEYSNTTMADVLSFLDKRLDEIDNLTIEVEDSEGYIRFSIGADGRVLDLFIHESARTHLTNLQLEQKFTDMLTAAEQERVAARNEIVANAMTWRPPPRRQQ